MSAKDWKSMSFHKEEACWMVAWDDETGYKMRCGEWFELSLGYGKILACRLELGSDWYIITGHQGVCFYLKQNETYQIHFL